MINKSDWTRRERALYRKLGAEIRAAREASGMSQERLARKVGLSRTSICNIEGGKQKPLIDTLVLIAGALDTKAYLLLAGAE